MPRTSVFCNGCISTHALTEGDKFIGHQTDADKISTHALTEGDLPPFFTLITTSEFQLTPSRRATYSVR